MCVTTDAHARDRDGSVQDDTHDRTKGLLEFKRCEREEPRPNPMKRVTLPWGKRWARGAYTLSGYMAAGSTGFTSQGHRAARVAAPARKEQSVLALLPR